MLHVFDRACNLIDSDGQVISLVSVELGPGPFSIVVHLAGSFRHYIQEDAPVSVANSALNLGTLTVETNQASLWQPEPAWARLQRQPELLQLYLPTFNAHSADHPRVFANAFRSQGRQRFAAAAELLFAGLASQDKDACRQGAAGLAGLGEGLTPAGDDFLVGVIYALWATGTAKKSIDILVQVAGPRTTTLSAAWLRAAGRGEAVEAWHDLLEAVSENDDSAVERALQGITAIGSSSGRDALAGFTAWLARCR